MLRYAGSSGGCTPGGTRRYGSIGYVVIRSSFDQVAAENRFLLRVAQRLVVDDRIDADRPVEWRVGAEHHLAGAHLGDQVADAFLREHHRVRKDVRAHVVARLLLDDAVLTLSLAGDLGPAEIRRQISAAMRAAHLQVRELVERPVEDQA